MPVLEEEVIGGMVGGGDAWRVVDEFKERGWSEELREFVEVEEELWSGFPRMFVGGFGVAGVMAGVEGPVDPGDEGWTTHILAYVSCSYLR